LHLPVFCNCPLPLQRILHSDDLDHPHDFLTVSTYIFYTPGLTLITNPIQDDRPRDPIGQAPWIMG
jgi:hypothetical protein